MKQLSIPILFGITGHRDLRPTDKTYLKQAVQKILKSYQANYPNTEIILISALAEGADILAAEVARDLGITLKVVIPYDESEYLKSFGSKDVVKQYKSLVVYADGKPIFPPRYNKKITDKELCYEILGDYLADTSNILIALYDGVDTGKAGGTSAVIKNAREGKKYNLFDPLDGDSIFIINTPRLSNPKIKIAFQENREFLGMMDEKKFHEMLRKIDQVNKAINAELSQSSNESLCLLENYQDFFDSKANKKQTTYMNKMKLILSLSGLGILSLELMHNIPKLSDLIIAYVGFLLWAFVIYWLYMKKGQLQDDFVFSRAFSEAIRVQLAWKEAGINQPVSKYYLANQPNKFTWVRVALKNLYFLDNSPNKNKDSWIDGQVDYLEEKLPERKKTYKLIEKFEITFFYLGIATLTIVAVLYFKEVLPYIIGQAQEIKHGHFPYNWHHYVLLSGVLLLSAGFLNKYLAIGGIKEDVYNFRIMKPDFEKAREWIHKNKNNKELQKQIVYDLGKKALEENSKWVELHDARRAKPEVE